MTDSYDEIEARIQAALASISREENPNIVKLARDYAVSESRLQACYKEQKNRSNCEEEILKTSYYVFYTFFTCNLSSTVSRCDMLSVL